MGAIFNTKDTLKLLDMVNKHYRPGNAFKKVRNDQENIFLRDFPAILAPLSAARKNWDFKTRYWDQRPMEEMA